jgi:hypothetical protein
MTAIELVKQRKEQRRQEAERKASNQLKLILSAAERNPDSLGSDTVRQFVEKNAKVLPGLQEWYTLETAALADPASPRNSYNKLLANADSYASGVQSLAKAGAPGPFGMAFKMGGQIAAEHLRQNPEAAFDAGASTMKPSELLRAEEHAHSSGVQIPRSDRTLRNKKVDGPLYVLSNPDQYPPEVVKAARIALELEQPEKDPDQKLNDYLYVVENPHLFAKDTVEAARAHLKLQHPPTHEEKGPEDELSGVARILQNPGRYAPEVVEYARAVKRNAQRNAAGEPPGIDQEDGNDSDSETERRLTPSQATSSVESYLSDLYENYKGAGLRNLSLGQRRKAAQMLRAGEDVDTFLLNSVLPTDGRSLKKVVNYYLRESKRNEKGAAAKLEKSALALIQARRKAGMSPEAARASVLGELLERALADRVEARSQR